VIVDSHHHFWDPATAEYPWLNDDVAPIRRRFGPEDLAPLLLRRGVDATVVVQARSSLDETRELLATAAKVPWLAGVVGWVDLVDPNLDDVLADLCGGGLVGVRHQAHDEPDPAWLNRPEVERGLDALERAGLAFDLLVRARELPAAVELARRHPGVRFVVDHLAKPPVRSGDLRGGDLDSWAGGLAALAELPNVACKLSGIVTEANWRTWSPAELLPYLRRALDYFGPDRSMFGSDWPVCLLAADYDAVVDLLLAALDDLDSRERAAVLGGTACRIYRLEHSG
jgi:L-fuconolactonase